MLRVPYRRRRSQRGSSEPPIARVELDLVVNEGWPALADYRRRLGKD